MASPAPRAGAIAGVTLESRARTASPCGMDGWEGTVLAPGVEVNDDLGSLSWALCVHKKLSHPHDPNHK